MPQPLAEWPTWLVADVALKAEDAISRGIRSEKMADRRNEMLDELVRRGAIESYSLVPGDHVQPA